MTETFAQLRSTRFDGAPARLKAVLLYLEQLALQTSTHIDNWNMTPFLALDTSDKRAINAAFFAYKEGTLPGIEALSVETEASLAEVKLATEEQQAERLDQLKENHKQYMAFARDKANAMHSNIKAAWKTRKEIHALEQTSAESIVGQLRELLKEGFWGFHDYKNQLLRLETLQSIILTEVQPQASIHRRVDMGKYLMALNIRDMKLTVERYKQNPVIGDIYHPYVNGGSICWGDAVSLASDMLSKGEIKNVGGLLASLLTTYSTSSTPYETLHSFSQCEHRWDAHEQAKDESISDDEDECDICGGDRNDCSCCQACENSDCTCCSICSGTDRDNCDCCRDCGRRDNQCGRCRVCDEHDGCGCCHECERNDHTIERRGHAPGCSNETQPEEDESLPATPVETPTNSEEIPF